MRPEVMVEHRSAPSLEAPGPVWVDGELHDGTALPAEVATFMGACLGISPACHLVGPGLLDEHGAALRRGAELLGYTIDDPAGLDRFLADAAGDGSTRVVALVPTPSHHRATPPGAEWSPVAGECPVPEPSPLRLGISPWPRNHRSPAASVQLLDDTELLFGARVAADAGHDAQLWLNLDGEVACIDQGALVARLDGRLVTPPLDSGAVHTASRSAAVQHGPIEERALSLRDLRLAAALAVIQPWGTVHPVASVADARFADPSLADELAGLLAIAQGPTR